MLLGCLKVHYTIFGNKKNFSIKELYVSESGEITYGLNK